MRYQRKSQKKENISVSNVSEVPKSCVFLKIRVSGQSKSRPIKAAGTEVGYKINSLADRRGFAHTKHFGRLKNIDRSIERLPSSNKNKFMPKLSYLIGNCSVIFLIFFFNLPEY